MFRDLALIVDESVSNKDIIDQINNVGSRYLFDIGLFDYFKGKQIPSGKKSLAYHLKFQEKNRTLTEEDVNKQMEKIINHLKNTINAEIRH